MGMYHRKHEVSPVDKKETNKLLTEEHEHPEGAGLIKAHKKSMLPVSKKAKKA